MSNATQPSRRSGDSRRRNSRGGRNRNQNNENRRGGDRGDRGERGTRGDRGPRHQGNSPKAEEFRLQSPRPPRGTVPVKLTWWQKLLKIIGLYKEPVRPPRPERAPRTESAQAEPRPPKSNTRNARSGGADAGEPSERPAGQPKRGNRSGDRPRGGDRSTVESPRVYVGNLSYDVTEQDLQELFKGVGPVRNVEIVYNRTTHRSKGYGFVEMLHMDEAIRAVEVLHDQHFMGRKLTVSGAKSKGQDEREEAEDRPSGESRVVALAPLPAPAAATEPAAAAPTAADDSGEPTIQTIIENVTEAPVTETVEEGVTAAAEENKPTA